MRNPLKPTVHSSYILALALVLAPGVAAAQKSGPPQADCRLDGSADDRHAGRARSRGIFARRNRRPRWPENAADALQNSPANPVAAQRSRRSPRCQSRWTRSTPSRQQDVAGPFIDKMPSDMMESAKLRGADLYVGARRARRKISQQSRPLTKLNPGAHSGRPARQISVPDVEPFSCPQRPTTRPRKRQQARSPLGANPLRPQLLEVIISGDTKSLTVREPAARF